jgi:nitroreductase
MGGTANETLRQYLETRRSTPAIRLGEPGPSREEIEAMLTIASRVPDHGKLTPWRFVVYSGEARKLISEKLAGIAESRAALSDEERAVERERLTRAPVVIAVVSKAVADHPKIPEWEQILSAGVAAYNIFLAANAHGYGANWLTEWYAYDEEAHRVLGIEPGERVVGFVHIGTADFRPADRPRPDLADVVTWME